MIVCCYLSPFVQDAFKIDNETGVVAVNRRLNREVLDTATLEILVQDLNAAHGTHQSATGESQHATLGNLSELGLRKREIREWIHELLQQSRGHIAIEAR